MIVRMGRGASKAKSGCRLVHYTHFHRASTRRWGASFALPAAGYLVMMPQAMRSPALPAGSLIIVIGLGVDDERGASVGEK